MVTLYGIRNCDTMKKAMRWLEQQDVAYRFHDVRKQGLERKRLLEWEKELGWEALLNRRGMLWRRLDPATREHIDRERAIALMLDDPGIIKRPVLDLGRRRVVGFSPEAWAELFH